MVEVWSKGKVVSEQREGHTSTAYLSMTVTTVSFVAGLPSRFPRFLCVGTFLFLFIYLVFSLFLSLLAFFI